MLLTNTTLATMQADAEAPYGLIENAALVIEGDQIAWVGPQADVPTQYRDLDRVDLQGRLTTPGLIDCHTHLVFAGNRAREFEMRLQGASYTELAKAGGGIVSTVSATRATDLDGLVALALPRLDALIGEGVSTIEIKSGYGLDRETELNMLRAARRLAQLRPVKICTSFLGAHAIPPEYAGRADMYIDDVCIPTLRAAHAQGLVDAVDGFCEGIAFDAAQIRRVFNAARELDLPIKLHAEQLSHMSATALACEFGALSVDHIEYATASDAALMAKAGTVATLLPGAFYTLRETQMPPVDALREHGVPIAIATDANPGSSPLFSPVLTMNMACTLFRLTPEESLRGMTLNAARALGLNNVGTLAPNMQADLAIWDVQHPAELAYRIGFNPLHQRFFKGVAQ
ncbi:MAG: imidazolonepropionase [Ascidiaceihabitans sp.]|jgi:imidazolonepropionase